MTECYFCGGEIVGAYIMTEDRPFHLTPLECVRYLEKRIKGLEEKIEARSKAKRRSK